jgi:hypothetical protein
MTCRANAWTVCLARPRLPGVVQAGDRDPTRRSQIVPEVLTNVLADQVADRAGDVVVGQRAFAHGDQVRGQSPFRREVSQSTVSKVNTPRSAARV